MYFNAHCHLELGFLHRKLPPGLPFHTWLERLVPLKRSASAEESAASALAGLEELRATGTVGICDILSLDTAAKPLFERASLSGFSAFLFWEMIAFDPAAAASLLSLAFARQADAGKPPLTTRHGLSPHAPYTTSSSLLRLAAMASWRTHQRLCIHAAESPEETEMMLHGTGPLRDFLAPFMPINWTPPGLRPIPYLDACDCLLPGTLLVHCNDLDDEDIALIGERGCSVVVCPGTHVYFGRGEFPLSRLLAAGIPTYLGTDSLASNDALDMRREIALACELTPGVPEHQIAALADATRAKDFGLGARRIRTEDVTP